MKTISAGEANRHFSSLLRDVATGEIITVLSRSRPVATLSSARADDGQRQMARLSLLARLRQQKVSGERDWTRDELYEGR